MPSNLPNFSRLFTSLSLSRIANNTEAQSRTELKTTPNPWVCQHYTIRWPIATHFRSPKSSKKSPMRTPMAFLRPSTF
ncbi:hypothetical protein TIFTF001_043730 [Ficus carica]|uniref:Uncharacterized protein n=1 Tax=Ficus carica TaxID=3494 RepID=A0AA88CMW5_FICCA|nr:hypothetical protein TIFTF001_043730 [Ficus carica]